MKKVHRVVSVAKKAGNIPVGEWLVDVTPGHMGQPTLSMFRVLEVGDGVVEVEDEDRCRRIVNSMVLEIDLENGDVIRTRDFREEGR